MSLPDDIGLHLIETLDDVLDFNSWLGSRDAVNSVAVDTEGTGLVIGHDTVRLVQVGGRQHGWAIPWDGWWGLFDDFVRRYEGRFIMHNAKYDFGMLNHMGVTLPTGRIDDTRVLSHILEPNMSTALKSQAGRHVDDLAASAQGDLHKAIGPRGQWTWATVPIKFGPYWQYAALDTILTAHLFDYAYPLVMADAPKSYEIELAVTWVIERMERRGVHIDVPYAVKTKADFDRFVVDADAWVQKTYGVKSGSNQAIVGILKDAGFSFDKVTAGGAASLDKEVLGGISHPLAETVLARRQLQKLSTTYMRHFIEEVDGEQLIHPSINTLGARTSRMSMERPNLQNLPRKSEKNRAAETVRNSITTRYELGALLMCDFDQIEMRLLAHMSGERGMIEAFKGDTDFFVALARQIFADPTIVKSDQRRQVTKNGGYATIYGAGIAKFAKTAGISEQASRAFFESWNGTYPAVPRFQKEVERVAYERLRAEGVPYARSPLTRRRHIADHGKIYALVNYLIQGAAAETFKQKLIELDHAGLGEFMILPVHDEVILDVPEESIPEVVETLRTIMNDATLYDVPITAGLSMGKRWGMKEDYEDATI